jgi:hypothetical protein
MARDEITSKFKVDIHLTLTPINKYGDVLSGGGEIRYVRAIEVKNMMELAVYLERLNQKPFEYIQMVDPPSANDDSAADAGPNRADDEGYEPIF